MRLRLLIIGVFFAALACTSSVPAAPPSAPPPPPTPDPLNRVADLQARMAQTEDYDKFVVDEDVVVWFIPCSNPPATWVAAMFGYHLPSASVIYFNSDGTVKSSPRPSYESEEARVRLEALAADTGLMGRIISARTAPDRCPEEFRSTFLRHDTAEVFDPDLRAFLPTGDMQVARVSHTSTLLNDGRVLVVGGANLRTSEGVTAELFDPISDTFSFTGRLAAVRTEHAAALLHDGKVLIVGGYDGESNLASAEVYDPVTGKFAPTGDMTVGRRNPTATLLANGKVLIVGGTDKRARNPLSAELYDPDTGTFSATGDVNTFRRNHTATLLSNGDVLIVGGDNAGDGSGSMSVERYDTQRGEFRSADSLEERRERHTASLISDGRVVITGGYLPVGVYLDSAEVYDSFAGRFADNDDGSADLAVGRERHTATVLRDGRMLVTGGRGRGPTLKSAELYDIFTGAFIQVGELSVGRYRHSAVLLADGGVLITGGTRD